MANEKIYLYPKWLRVWHGVNALCIILLIFSGISMQYSGEKLTILRFDIAVSVHNISGIIVAVNYLLFIIGNIVTVNGLQYKLQIKGLKDRLVKQSAYYLSGYFKNENKPFPISVENKFNPLQRVSYIGAMYVLVPLVIISGIALLYPEIIVNRIFNISGIQLTAIFHSIIGFFISIFLIIHLYVASVGKNPLKNYRSIMTGYHEE